MHFAYRITLRESQQAPQRSQLLLSTESRDAAQHRERAERQHDEDRPASSGIVSNEVGLATIKKVAQIAKRGEWPVGEAL